MQSLSPSARLMTVWRLTKEEQTVLIVLLLLLLTGLAVKSYRTAHAPVPTPVAAQR